LTEEKNPIFSKVRKCLRKLRIRRTAGNRSLSGQSVLWLMGQNVNILKQNYFPLQNHHHWLWKGLHFEADIESLIITLFFSRSINITVLLWALGPSWKWEGKNVGACSCL